MSWVWVHSVIDQLLNQQLYVRYFTKLNLCLLIDWPLIKAETCVRYFTELIWGTFSNQQVIKPETMCYLFYWVDLGYIQ